MPSGLHGQHFGGGRGRRHDRHTQSVAGEPAQDVVLDAEVVGDDQRLHRPAMPGPRRCSLPALRPGPASTRHAYRRPSGTASSQVTSWTRSRPSRPSQCCAMASSSSTVWLPSVQSAACSTPLIAQMARQRARVHLADAGDAVAGQVVGQRLVGAPVGDDRAHLAHDEGGDLRAIAFHILGVDAGVAHVRHRHADHLAAVGWVGNDLLIAGQAGVEDHFADHGRRSAESLSLVYGAIL